VGKPESQKACEGARKRGKEEREQGGEYRVFFLLVFSVFSVPLW